MENNEGLPTDSPSDDDSVTGTSDAAAEGADIPTGRRPLGYWLRLVDALITREFASTLENEGVGRRDWMLLNVLSRTSDAPGFAERLARRGKHLRRLEERGWVAQQGDGSWALTDDGRAAQERLSGLVAGIRDEVAGAVSPEDFATLTASLEAIARELGWDEEAAWPGGGFRGRGFGGGFGPRFGGGFGPGFGRGPWHGHTPEPADDAESSPRPRPMDGPNLHRGFGPGGGPRHPHGHGSDSGRGRGFEHGGEAEACGHPHHGGGFAHRRGFEHGEGHHEHPRRHGGGGKARQAAEHAYERGFIAGFEAGRRPGTVDPAA